LNFPISP
nr:Chain C, PR/RT substrate peptide [Human immunodeficiency virus 1]